MILIMRAIVTTGTEESDERRPTAEELETLTSQLAKSMGAAADYAEACYDIPELIITDVELEWAND